MLSGFKIIPIKVVLGLHKVTVGQGVLMNTSLAVMIAPLFPVFVIVRW